MTPRRSLGTKQRRGPGKWLIGVTIGYGEDGKQQRKYETFHGTAAQADRRIAELADHYEHSPQARQRLTFQRFAETKYIPHVRRKRRQETVEGYESKLTLHVYPRVGDRPIDDLQPYDFDDMLAWLEDAGMSAASRRHVRRVAMQVMNYASAKGYVPHWDSRRVEDPDVPPAPKDTLTAEEARAYLNAFVGHEVEMAVVLGLCGMRVSEICGVRHEDVDLDAGVVWIRRGVHRVKGGYTVEDTKTAGSAALVPLTARAIAAYKRHRGFGYLFQRPNGDPLLGDVVWRKYKEHVVESELRYVPLRCLRHTTATLALKHRGAHTVNTRAVADHLRHSTVTTTEAFYYDREGAVDRSVADVLDDVYGVG